MDQLGWPDEAPSGPAGALAGTGAGQRTPGLQVGARRPVFQLDAPPEATRTQPWASNICEGPLESAPGKRTRRRVHPQKRRRLRGLAQRGIDSMKQAILRFCGVAPRIAAPWSR
jgi:hypothetical protein